ncbi:hypothetical protein PHYBLDRAFT_96992, partial [Phycomyces blakesleeanus NRRL 1555(-)]
IEQVVTKLLRTTKALLEALTQWSQMNMSTNEILEIHETLEIQFYSVSRVFEEANVSMGDLGWIPKQLRECVSGAMEQEQSIVTLDQHLPRIRDVIVHLLHGLKGKQQQLRERDHAAFSRDQQHRTDSWHSTVPQAVLARNASHQRAYNNGATSPPPMPSDALAALKRQENLARRSSVRRASMFRTGGNEYNVKRGLDAPPVPALPNETTSKLSNKLTSVPEAAENLVEKETRQGKFVCLTLYLQISKDVKKIHYTGEISVPALRMLFIEKFGYTSRQSDFPSIYIREPGVHVFYELEDLSEVIDKSVLSLNLNDTPKHQGTVLRDLVQKMIIEHRPTSVLEGSEGVNGVLNGAGTTAMPPSGMSREAVEQHLAEVESLRRDLAVLRQLQGEMKETTADVLGGLKAKAVSLREQAKEPTTANVSAAAVANSNARLFIEEGKEQLLTSSDKITTRLEDLQDTIDQLKLDVTLRKSSPSEAQMTHCSNETKALAQEIDQFGAYIARVKPTWKKTWEQELQTIVKEQQSVKEQEGLLLDMKDDLAALLEVFEQLEKICVYRAKARPVLREFRVAPAEEGFEGMASVFKQVTTIDVDHERRLKALEQAEKMRQREILNKVDDFEKELGSFVEAKKLKKTGGAQEIERIRQQKDKDLLKAMY